MCVCVCMRVCVCVCVYVCVYICVCVCVCDIHLLFTRAPLFQVQSYNEFIITSVATLLAFFNTGPWQSWLVPEVGVSWLKPLM